MNASRNSSSASTNFGLIVGAVIVWALLSIYIYFEGVDWFMPEAASAEAESIDELFRVMLGIGSFIFLLVQTTLWYFVVRYGLMRNRNDDSDGPPIHGNNTIELIWTVIPTIIVFFLTIISFQVLVDTTEAKDDEFPIQVTAQRFFWSFEYPNDEGFELTQNHILVVPEGETVRLEMDSLDVIHAFWVPEFRVKQDVMPGRTSELRFTPTVTTGLPADIADNLLTRDNLDLPDENTACPEPEDEAAAELENPVDDAEAEATDETASEASDSGQGVPPVNYEEGYDIVCAELCGGNHGLMRGEVFVVTEEEYEAYIESLKANIVKQEAEQAFAVRCGGAAIADAGRAIFAQYGCNTCHQLNDANSLNMGAGPSLNGLGARAGTHAGYDSPEDYIRTSIVNPNAFIVDGYAANIMPQNFAQQMSTEEIDLLVAYLASITE